MREFERHRLALHHPAWPRRHLAEKVWGIVPSLKTAADESEGTSGQYKAPEPC